MDYDALENHARRTHELGIFDAVAAGEYVTYEKLADAIADLRARNEALCDIIFRYVDPCDVLPEDDTVVAEAIAANREG